MDWMSPNCQVMKLIDEKEFKKRLVTMNYSKDGSRVCHHEQKYFYSFCNFRTHKKYNLEMHKKNKNGTSQTFWGSAE